MCKGGSAGSHMKFGFQIYLEGKDLDGVLKNKEVKDDFTIHKRTDLLSTRIQKTMEEQFERKMIRSIPDYWRPSIFYYFK